MSPCLFYWLVKRVIYEMLNFQLTQNILSQCGSIQPGQLVIKFGNNKAELLSKFFANRGSEWEGVEANRLGGSVVCSETSRTKFRHRLSFLLDFIEAFYPNGIRFRQHDVLLGSVVTWLTHPPKSKVACAVDYHANLQNKWQVGGKGAKTMEL